MGVNGIRSLDFDDWRSPKGTKISHLTDIYYRGEPEGLPLCIV